MHETSVVRALLQQTAGIVRREGGGSVKTIRIEIGPLSGVEPLLVSSAFASLVGFSECAGADLEIVEVSLQVRCRSCGAEFDLPDYRFECRACGSRTIDVVRGDEVRILDVTIEPPLIDVATKNSFEGEVVGNRS